MQKLLGDSQAKSLDTNSQIATVDCDLHVEITECESYIVDHSLCNYKLICNYGL